MNIEVNKSDIVSATPLGGALHSTTSWSVEGFAKESTTAWIHIGNDFVRVYYQMFWFANIPQVYRVRSIGNLVMEWNFDRQDDAARFINTGKAISVVSMINSAFMKHDRNSYVVQNIYGEAHTCGLEEYIRERGNPF